MALISILFGFALLTGGGEILVRGAVGVAQKLGVSTLLVGLVLVGFGTSTPELVTSLKAAFIGAPGFVIGNVVGSNIANILLILGLTAMIAPLACDRRAFKRDGPMLLLATALCAGVAMMGEIGRIAGVSFVLFLAAYIFFTYRSEKRAMDASARMHVGEAEVVDLKTDNMWISAGLTAVGIVLVALGAEFMVNGSVTIARSFGIPETIIGLTILAVGSSLPELATSTIAAMRNQPDVAFGNIVGSCIFNSLGILGITAVVTPIAFPPASIMADLVVMAGVTLWLSVLAFYYGQITRIQGTLFVLSFAAYFAYLFDRSGLA